MRRRWYLKWLAVVSAVSLVPALIWTDVLDAALRLRKPMPVDRLLAWLYDAFMTGPLGAARMLGISIGSHSAQAWPSGWPPSLAHDLKVCLLFIPFWFVVGLPVVESLLRLSRRRSGVQEGRA